MVWWLSIDNAFEYLSVQKVNLNALRTERVLHTYQSGYAHQVIRALGCHRTLPLSDYTPGVTDAASWPKTDIAINANHKVLYDVGAIAARLERENGCRVHLIRGMSRAQLDAVSAATTGREVKFQVVGRDAGQAVRRRLHRFARAQDGATAVEFALLLAPFLLLFFGLIFIGFVMFAPQGILGLLTRKRAVT
mgnify:CR=1 FL=1